MESKIIQTHSLGQHLYILYDNGNLFRKNMFITSADWEQIEVPTTEEDAVKIEQKI